MISEPVAAGHSVVRYIIDWVKRVVFVNLVIDEGCCLLKNRVSTGFRSNILQFLVDAFPQLERHSPLKPVIPVIMFSISSACVFLYSG